MEQIMYDHYMIPRKIVEDIEKAFGKDKAPALVKALEQGLDSINQKNKKERALLKAEIKEEIASDLVTKDYFDVKMKNFDIKMQNLEMKIQSDMKKLENTLLKWILGLFIAQIATFAGIVQLIR